MMTVTGSKGKAAVEFNTSAPDFTSITSIRWQ
jgi:hypothetical protein